jgi:hypothetical protein
MLKICVNKQIHYSEAKAVTTILIYICIVIISIVSSVMVCLCHIHVRMHSYAYICARTHMRDTYTYMHEYTYAHAYAQTQLQTPTRTHMHIHTQTLTYTHALVSTYYTIHSSRHSYRWPKSVLQSRDIWLFPNPHSSESGWRTQMRALYVSNIHILRLISISTTHIYKYILAFANKVPACLKIAVCTRTHAHTRARTYTPAHTVSRFINAREATQTTIN